jgi:hypothetical protein
VCLIRFSASYLPRTGSARPYRPAQTYNIYINRRCVAQQAVLFFELLSFPPRRHSIQNRYVSSAAGVRRPPEMKKGAKKFSFLIIWPIRRLHHSSYLLARGNLKPSQQFPVIVVRYPPIQQAIPASSGTFSDVAYVLVAPSRQRLSLYSESGFCLHPQEFLVGQMSKSSPLPPACAWAFHSSASSLTYL